MTVMLNKIIDKKNHLPSIASLFDGLRCVGFCEELKIK
jgi:hypothetical protein